VWKGVGVGGCLWGGGGRGGGKGLHLCLAVLDAW
jgi:hypothetical protein